MKIEELQERLEDAPNHHIEFEGMCHDCGAPVKVVCGVDDEGGIVISGGAVYHILLLATTGTPERWAWFVKGDKCYSADPVLRLFQPTDIYSRVVGYLRPVGGWNKGKQEEFNLRREFVVDEGERNRG